MINVEDENVSSISMWNILNQLVKHEFSCGLAVSNLKQKKTFSNQMNGNILYLVPARRDRSCCSIEKLRCSNSAVNETFK